MMHCTRMTRRMLLRQATSLALAGRFELPARSQEQRAPRGFVIGEPMAEIVGGRVLAEGGNAVDAIVAAALAGAVAAPHQTGIGGYGASGVLAVDGGKKIVALDANSAAPAAMTADIFKPVNGKVPGKKNEIGWLAAGVPGILAGLQLILERFGTRPFRELVQPARRVALEGFRWTASLAKTIRDDPIFAQDAGGRRIYFRDDKPLAAGDVYRNPELADMLDALAKANSVQAFYRGDIAQRIAEGFQKNGGLVTAKDLAAYQARLVEPLTLTWGEHVLHTAPLAAGGLTILQAMKTLQALQWEQKPQGIERTHARIEALRWAWRDRLTLLGDPEHTRVPQQRLLSDDYARSCADKIEAAVKAGKLLTHDIERRDQGGTINLSAIDDRGNFVALTLTHGQAFGARVTVDGLGLTLGHGMSRFDPQPGHPNGPGPGKRPLHNMCPTLVTRSGTPVLAIGGRGGRKIPNAMCEALTRFVVLGQALDAALTAPRLHTEGDATLTFEPAWPADEQKALQQLGYKIEKGGSAVLSAVALESGRMKQAIR